VPGLCRGLHARRPVLDREARVAAGEGATTLGDHPFSLITCIRVSCASNAGKLEVGSHSWRSLFAPACPGNGFSLREPGYWYTFFNFDLTEGSQGTSPFDLGHLGQTRFGHARSERRRPQFTAHNSVRPFENGLRSLGSSAIRPGGGRAAPRVGQIGVPAPPPDRGRWYAGAHGASSPHGPARSTDPTQTSVRPRT